MASKEPGQTLERSKKNKTSALSKLINERLTELNWTQKNLCEAANMPESRLSRIMRGRKGKGNTVAVNELDLAQIAIALKIGKVGMDRLRYAAWPELTLIDQAFRDGESVIALNSRLYENGFPMLGIDNPKE